MKKTVTSMLTAILLISTFSALAAMIAPSKAAYVGVFEVSQTQFSGNAIIQMRLFDPDLNVDPAKRESAYVTYTKGTNTTALWLNETLPNSGEFIGYIRNITSTLSPKNPPYGQTYHMNNLILKSGDTFTLTYSDASPVGTISVTVTYTAYTATSGDISLDRASLEYPMNGFIRVSVKDLDYNYDPTKADSVKLNITFRNPVNNKKVSQVFYFTETGANTAVFSMNTSVSYYTSNNFKGYKINLTDLVTVPSPIQVIYGNETTPVKPYKFITLKTFPVVLEVASSFTTSGDLLIKVTDPNLEHKSWLIETLGTIAKTNVTVKLGTDIVKLDTSLRETGAGTAVFQAKVPVVIGTVASDSTLQYNLTSKLATIKYYANGTLAAEAVSTLSTTPAVLKTDKTMYKAGAIVTLSLTAPDLNDDDVNINYFSFSLPSGNAPIKDINVSVGGVIVGRFAMKVNGLDARSSTAQTLTFIETGVNTGIFTATLNLSRILSNTNASLKNGDSVQVLYTDNINMAVASASFTIGVAAATIDLDRTTYPVPKESNVAIHLTVADSEANTSPTTVQTKPAYVDVYYFNGTRKASIPVTLTETGPNTGVFTGTYTLIQNTSSLLINGWVTARCINPATGLNVSKTATLTARDASISTSKTTVKAGDALTITVNDPDKNFNSKGVESTTVKYEYIDAAGTLQTGSWTLSESGVNTATFTRTLTIGLDIKVMPGTTIKLTYEDFTPSYITASSGYPTTPVRYTANVKVASHTGTLTTDKTEYGIGSTMIITVNDPDLNKDITARENVQVTLRVAGMPDVTLTLWEANASSPVFTTMYSWPNNKDYIGKTFQVYYLDVADANGNANYAIVTGYIKSWDASVAFDKAYYNVGEIAVIRITDPDRNRIPGQIETFTVTVSSTSDPLGQTITAVETDANTGVFTARIQIASAFETGKVYAKVGDTLTASYRDECPADYATTLQPKTFTGTAIVGVPVERPVPASSPKFIDPNTGAERTSGKVGEAIMLQATVTNVDAVSRPFTAIFKVKDSAGVTIFISWVSGTLAPGQSLTPAVSWTPRAAGTYTIEILVVKSIADPTPYSDKVTVNLTVTA